MNLIRKTGPALGLALWTALTVACPAPCGAAGKSGTQVKHTAEQAVTTDARTQQAVEAWQAEKRRLLADIAQAEARLESLAWQRRQAKDYGENLRRKIADLQRRAAAMESMQTTLLPLLEATLDRLQTFVADDLPWQRMERREALDRARGTLDDYDTGLLPKIRAALEAVAREADLGHSVALQDAEISVDGQPRQVSMLRVGRLGLYALTTDAAHAYVWQDEAHGFVPLEQSRDIKTAMLVAEGTRLPELTRLPMGAPASQADAGEEPADED